MSQSKLSFYQLRSLEDTADTLVQKIWIMQVVSVYADLFSHNDWANNKVFDLCDGLSDEQLDQPKEMGFGSLRNTLFHNLDAEKLWLERWRGDPWRPLQADAEGASVDEIRDEAHSLAEERNKLIAAEAESGFTRIVDFRDLKGRAWQFSIDGLLNHVSNHGIHHRAQALNMLRGFERTVPGGLDYLFWKLAFPSCEQPAESLEPMRQYGLGIAEAEGATPGLDSQMITQYFTYGDWAYKTLIELADSLDDAQLDHKFDMGMGSMRRNLQHIIDGERWWVENWAADHASFPRGEDARSVSQMKELYWNTTARRNERVQQLDEAEAQRIVNVTAGGPVSRFRVLESMLQLCGHSTHHRAQCINMFRQSGVQTPGLDMIDWLRNNAA